MGTHTNGTIVLNGLLGSSTYFVQIALRNRVGLGGWSEPSQHFTTQAAIAPSPLATNVRLLSSDEIPFDSDLLRSILNDHAVVAVEQPRNGSTGGSRYVCTELYYLQLGQFGK